MKNFVFLALTSTFIVGCSNNGSITSGKNTVVSEDTIVLKAIAKIIAKNNSNVGGTVTFSETNGKVSMNAQITGLTPGEHAIHIHAVGDCSAADGSSAGGHWNPTNVNHGKWGIAPFHIGDIGNIVADSNGIGTFVLETDLWCINCSDKTKNIVGNSFLIHEGADDFVTQPSGAAGSRIGCGKITEQ
jgi:Cu-Zn family superoxide dismutase